MAALFRIHNWSENFENNRTRELRRMEWVPMPNKHDGDGYRTIMCHPRGIEFFGCWVLLVEVASKCDPRGELVRANGTPHTAASIARITGAPEESLSAAIEFLSSAEVGWLEDAGQDPPVPCEGNVDASDAEKKRAHGRVTYSLKRGDELWTPKGRMSLRPTACQWCDSPEKKGGRGVTNMIAHHPIGYGNKLCDKTVVFVCRSCHGFFESGKFTTGDIISRYGTSWLPQGDASSSRVAGDSSQPAANTRLWNGMEVNGTEEKKEDCSKPPKAASEPASEWRFPTVGTAGQEWALPLAKLNEFTEAFPGIEVAAELRKARQWCRDNPAKRKTTKGMLKFLNRWLSRAQDAGSRVSVEQRFKQPQKCRVPTDDELANWTPYGSDAL